MIKPENIGKRLSVIEAEESRVEYADERFTVKKRPGTWWMKTEGVASGVKQG